MYGNNNRYGDVDLCPHFPLAGGKSLHRIYVLYTHKGDAPFGLSCWILVFFACQLALSQAHSPRKP